MVFRFTRRIRLAPGLSINLSKSGISASAGPRGAKLTAGTSGVRGSAGLPGTGLYFTKQVSRRRASSQRGRSQTRRTRADTYQAETGMASPEMAHFHGTLEKPLPAGFFSRLFISKNEKSFVDGCKELFADNTKNAYKLFLQCTDLADGAFMAGYLALNHGDSEPAIRCLKKAIGKRKRLGFYFSKYGLEMRLKLSISDEIDALVIPDHRGAVLGLVEACQLLKRYSQTLSYLESLHKTNPEDMIVRLSLIEILYEQNPNNKKTLQRINSLGKGLKNLTFVHSAIMLYRAKALLALNLASAARDALTLALRKRKGCPESLRHALLYDRAIVYEALKQKSRARADLEKIYMDDSDYKDINQRLGI